MDVYYPLLMLIIVAAFALCILPKSDMLARHAPILVFLIYALPPAIRPIAATAIGLPFSAINILTQSAFLYSAIYYSIALAATIAIYRIYAVHHSPPPSNAGEPFREVNVITETRSRVLRIYTAVATVIFLTIVTIRYIVLGSRADLVLTGSLANVDASRGWSFIPALLSPLLLLILLVLIEYHASVISIVYVFILQGATAFVAGSKVGIVLLVIAVYMYLLMRHRLRFRWRHVFIAVAIGIPNIVIGTYVRTLYAGIDTAPSVPLAIAQIEDRFTSLDISQIMLTSPEQYTGFKSTYWSYTLSVIVPSAIWPDKPLNPCFLIAPSLGYPSVACINGGWLGGILQLTGPLGIFVAPILVGVTLAMFSRSLASVALDARRSYPFAFFFGMLWLNTAEEGTYYTVIPVFIIPAIFSLMMYASLGGTTSDSDGHERQHPIIGVLAGGVNNRLTV
ncbi:MAG TPA: hypothetical protein DEV93_02300 [Chloroflexi bacterium]|nr:hypothetical protein [Chloroflexota bacterium]